MDDDESDALEAVGIGPGEDPVADAENEAAGKTALARLMAGFEDEGKLDAKFAALRETTKPASEALDRLRGISGPGAEIVEKLAGFAKADDLVASQRAVHEDLAKPFDTAAFMANQPDARAARASEKTAGYMSALVDAALKTDERETEMLRLSKRNTTLAAIAAVASVVSIIVAVVLALALG